ncbi:Scr1 family TA system antitoxin-like transcriptional regulator [Streptosporangium saharense]|uniref:Scr1 family TA system antitoxin-like transcriptional regulator n=1 Tax=Streptosporangium saharense TaxID=1706840 RepID=UPI0036A105E3
MTLTVSVLPFTPQHGFCIFDDRVVQVETVAAELTLTLSEEIRQYVRLFDWFAKEAHYGARARRIITQDGGPVVMGASDFDLTSSSRERAMRDLSWVGVVPVRVSGRCGRRGWHGRKG